MKEQLNIKGRVKVQHYDKDMQLIEIREFDNLVVASGTSWIAGRLNDPVPAIMNYIGLGTNNTPPVSTDTALNTEIYRSPVSISGGSVSTNLLVFTQNVGPGFATGALVEAGIFSEPTGGIMLSRVVYPVINKGASDTIAITWTIAIG